MYSPLSKATKLVRNDGRCIETIFFSILSFWKKSRAVEFEPVMVAPSQNESYGYISEAAKYATTVSHPERNFQKKGISLLSSSHYSNLKHHLVKKFAAQWCFRTVCPQLHFFRTFHTQVGDHCCHSRPTSAIALLCSWQAKAEGNPLYIRRSSKDKPPVAITGLIEASLFTSKLPVLLRRSHSNPV